MSDLTPKGTMITVDGVERKILFTFSVVDELQDLFGKSIDEIISEYLENASSEKNLSSLMKMTSTMLDVFARESDESIGHGHFDGYVTSKNVYEIVSLILSEYGLDLPDPEEDQGNLESGER